jgi:hypothetical protein
LLSGINGKKTIQKSKRGWSDKSQSYDKYCDSASFFSLCVNGIFSSSLELLFFFPFLIWFSRNISWISENPESGLPNYWTIIIDIRFKSWSIGLPRIQCKTNNSGPYSVKFGINKLCLQIYNLFSFFYQKSFVQSESRYIKHWKSMVFFYCALVVSRV